MYELGDQYKNYTFFQIKLFRQMEKYGIRMLKRTKPILSDLGTYLTKVRNTLQNPYYL
jgi:hypothetical protein